MPSCHSCGKQLQADTTFCPNCGTNVQQATIRFTQTENYPTSSGYPQPGIAMSPDERLAKITRRLEKLTYVVAFEAVVLLVFLLILFFA